MMAFPRQRLVSAAALTAYLVVNIGAGALHHHHQGTAVRPGMSPAACGTDHQFRAAGPAGDADDEETCLLCSVLHLAQTLPSKVHAGLLIVPTCEALPAPAIFLPPPLETPTHARSPPVA
jgi:hypothetical protein